MQTRVGGQSCSTFQLAKFDANTHVQLQLAQVLIGLSHQLRDECLQILEASEVFQHFVFINSLRRRRHFTQVNNWKYHLFLSGLVLKDSFADFDLRDVAVLDVVERVESAILKRQLLSLVLVTGEGYFYGRKEAYGLFDFGINLFVL